MADMLKRVPVRQQYAKERATNFEEVCYGYNQEEAMEEASRCLNCKNAKCIQGCPVSINIPGFIAKIKDGDIEGAYHVISESSALPAICGRVCPQETQCESKCVRGIKGEPVSIGKLERFVADYALEHDIKPQKAEKTNGHKVAVIGSGPSGLTCAGDLAKLGYEVTVFEALHELGGVLVYGIPEFRLPKEKVVKKEIEKVKELGVKFETNVVIGKSTTIDQLMEEEDFEAVFIGSGAGLPMFMGIPGETANGVFSANDEIIAVDIDRERLDVARRFGATEVHDLGDSSHQLPAVDVSIDYSGAPSAMEATVGDLAVGGVAVWVGGVAPRGNVSLNPETVVRRLLSIKGLHNYNADDFREAVAFITANHSRYPFASLVQKEFDLVHADDAFRYAVDRNPYRVGIRFD